MHTSAVSVAVLPQAEEVLINLLHALLAVDSNGVPATHCWCNRLACNSMPRLSRQLLQSAYSMPYIACCFDSGLVASQPSPVSSTCAVSMQNVLVATKLDPSLWIPEVLVTANVKSLQSVQLHDMRTQYLSHCAEHMSTYSLGL